MPKGKRSIGKRLLATAFGMAAGVLVGAADLGAQTPPPMAAPDSGAYRHPTLASPSNEDVGVLLVLAMDSSGSMSDEEWQIQLRATAAALLSTQVRATIRCKSGDRSVAIAVVDFADRASLRIPWVDLRPKSCSDPDPEFDRKIELLAAQIARLERRSSGGTNLGGVMQYALTVFMNAPWQPTERRVLDISGDGSNNGTSTEAPRQALMNYGVTINGIAIVNDEPTLDAYFRREIVSNQYRRSADGRSAALHGQVWVVARNMQSVGNNAMTLFTFGRDVENALKQKISMEVAGIYDQREIDEFVRQALARPEEPEPRKPERHASTGAAAPPPYALR